MDKKLHLLVFLFLFSAINVFSQQEKGIYGDENWLRLWTEFNSEDMVYNVPTQILSGNITKDTKLDKKETYLLLGNVFVTDSTTLTIDPGTVILGDYRTKGSLTISDGSRIIAKGTQTDPIIFSSNSTVKKKGDWGGIFILGNAPVNKIGDRSQVEFGLKPSTPENISYGGPDEASDSGIFKYVRIEYAGNRTKQYGYFNALTLAGVGSCTVIENIMVSNCQGNAFYISGGNTKISKLVSYKSRKKDIIINHGAQTQLSNSLVVKSPYFTASSGASSIYLASYDKKFEVDPTKKNTHLDAENLTLLILSDDITRDIEVGLVNEALYVKEGASFSIKKSIFSGYNPAVLLDSKIVVNNETLSQMEFSNMYFNNCKGNIFVEGKSNNEDLENWYGNSIFQNVYSRGSDKETFIEVNDINNSDFRLRINKIVASNLPDED